MQKYEKPLIEMLELEEQDIITLSVESGGDGPSLGDENWSN